MKIIGIDLSLTSTGIAIWDAGWDMTTTIKPGALRGVHRLDFIKGAVEHYAYRSHIAVIEGYSYGSRNSRQHSIGEAGGLVRHSLWAQNITTVEVPPKTLKKFATGNGNASKQDMIEAAAEKFNAEVSSDEADAMWLVAVGITHYLGNRFDLPKVQLSALKKVDFPSDYNIVEASND